MSKRIIPIWKSDGSCAEESKNKTFCMAPWSHTYISPQGERRLCCASREEHSFQKQYIDASNDERYGKVKESKMKAPKIIPHNEQIINLKFLRIVKYKNQKNVVSNLVGLNCCANFQFIYF